MNYSEENPNNPVTAADDAAAAEAMESAEAPAAKAPAEAAAETALKADDTPDRGEDENVTADESGRIPPVKSDDSSVATSDFITRSEAEELIERAYLRGRNQAIRAQMIDDSMLNGDDSQREGPADDIAEIFRTRPSVWDNSL